MMEPYQLLEQRFADWMDIPVENAVACSSGTAALHLACECLDLPYQSKILMSEYNMIACPRAAAMAGLVPKFIDCNFTDLLLNLDILKVSLGYQLHTSAVMITHIYGRQVEMARVHELCKPRNIKVIEDMSEMHGIKPHPDSHAACWSFYKNKIVAGEEGGLVYFKEKEQANKARQLRSLGFTEAHNYLHVPRGHNYRMSNCHAEKILDSLIRVSENLHKRAKVEFWYDSYLPKSFQQPARKVVWVYDVRIPGLESPRQDEIVKQLNSQGIGARHGFKPMTMQPEFSTQSEAYKLTQAYQVSQEVLYLPVNPMMTETEVKSNVTALLALL